jgi:secondary thiamine-phosphate synthase enzyme
MTQIDVRTSRRTEMIVITDQVQRAVTDSGVQSGLCYVQVPHTTAAVTINENADPDVPHDILHALDRLVPQNDPEYRHDEGNSAAHVKSSLFGALRLIAVKEGRLVLGTWQGIFFCEFDGPRTRHVLIKVVAG